MLSESEAIEDFSQVLQDPLTSFEQYAPRRRHEYQLSVTNDSSPSPAVIFTQTQLYVEIMRYATEIYLLRARSSMIPVDEQQMLEKIMHIRYLFQCVDQQAPGAHTLVWPAFVAAAETQEDENRVFFSAILRRIWEETGYANVLRGLESLPSIWKQQRQRRWTSILPNLKIVVM